jgi:hypothetical protein
MADLGITVKQLEEFCKKQIKKGNGDKHILISSDDEGNGFHTLFYQFSDADTEGFEDLLEMEHDGTHTKDNCVILG